MSAALAAYATGASTGLRMSTWACRKKLATASPRMRVTCTRRSPMASGLVNASGFQSASNRPAPTRPSARR